MNRLSIGSVLFALIAATSLASCTVGHDGAQGAPGVPCAGCVDATSLAANAVTGASIDPSTTLNAASFTFSSPVTNLYFADPTLCQRAESGIAPYQDIQVLHPTGNSFGPSLRISNTAAGTYSLYCPISLHIPNGAASVTITGATMAFYDGSTNCLVNAELRTKIMTTASFGVAASTVFDGASATDFAFTTTSASTKAFPTFSLAVGPLTLVWVHATIQIQNVAAATEDCRYSGVVLSYDVDRP